MPPLEKRRLGSIEVQVPCFDLTVHVVAPHMARVPFCVYRAAANARPCREFRRDFLEQSGITVNDEPALRLPQPFQQVPQVRPGSSAEIEPVHRLDRRQCVAQAVDQQLGPGGPVGCFAKRKPLGKGAAHSPIDSSVAAICAIV